MASEVSICNRALAAIGTRTSIAALTENSTEARACNLVYADTRDEILQMADWGFARKTAFLSLLKSAPGTPTNASALNATNWSTAYPAPPWLYEYQYPVDCLAVQRIVQQLSNFYVGVPLTSNGSSAYPFAVGPGSRFEIATDTDSNGQQQSVILTNQYQAIAKYTMKLTNPQLFGAQFVEALVQAIAAKLTLQLTGQVALANAKFQQANAIISAARSADGNEGLLVIDNMPDWITVRDDDYGAAVTDYSAPLGPLYGMI